MCDFISHMDADDVDYIAGDLLSKDQKKAFVSRLNFLKGKIEQRDNNQIIDDENAFRRFSAEDWNDDQKRDQICTRIMQDAGSAFSVLFTNKTKLAGKPGDRIWEAAEQERERIAQEKIRQDEEEQKRQEEERRQREEEERQRLAREEEERRRLAREEEERQRLAREEEERQRLAREEEERQREEQMRIALENARKLLDERKRQEEEEERRRKEEEEEERRRKEEEEDADEDEEDVEELSEQDEEDEELLEQEEEQQKKEAAEAKRKQLAAADLPEALQIVKADNEKLAEEEEDNFAEEVLNTYSEEEIDKAIKAAEDDDEISEKIDKQHNKILDLLVYREKEFHPPYHLREEESKQKLIEDEAQQYKDLINKKLIPFYENNIAFLKQYEIYLLKQGKTCRHFDTLLRKTVEYHEMIFMIDYDASRDLKKIFANPKFKEAVKNEKEKFEKLVEQRNELAEYLDNLKHRLSPEAAEQRKQAETFPDARFAEEKEHTEQDVKVAEKLTRDLITLRYSDKNKEELWKAENDLFADCKKSGISLDKFTKEEFENIKSVNASFAYRLYFDYVSINRDELKKESIPQNRAKDLELSKVTVFVQSKEFNKGENCYRTRIKRIENKYDKYDEKDILDIEKDGSFNCFVYPNPFSTKVTNDLKQGGTHNSYAYHGTCGPSALAQVVNQMYGMNITNENMNVTILHKVKTFGKHYLKERDETGKELLQDSPRPDWQEYGGSTVEDLSKLLDIFGIKHTKYVRNNPPADSDEKRDKKTGLDTDILLFADTLKKGGTVQVSVVSQILNSRGEDPRTLPDYYKNKDNLRCKKRLEKGRGFTNHWINLTGACYDDDGKLLGFLYKDSGNGESAFVSAKVLDKAFRGVVKDGKTFTVENPKFLLVEQSGHIEAAEQKKLEKERALQIKQENEMLEKLEKAGVNYENALIEVRDFYNDWKNNAKTPDYYKEGDVEKRAALLKAFKEQKKVYDDIKKDANTLSRIEKNERYLTIEAKLEKVKHEAEDGYAGIIEAYQGALDQAVPIAEEMLKKEFPDLDEQLKVAWSKDFFAAWENDLKSKDYSQEKHTEWYNKFKQEKKPLNDARDRHKEVCKAESKVNEKVLLWVNSYKTARKPMNDAIKKVNDMEKALAEKYKDIFGKLKKPEDKKKEVKKEDKKEEVKA